MASDKLLRRMQQLKNQIDNSKSNYLKLVDGNNYLRFLPSWRGDDEEWAIFIPTHYTLGPERRGVAACLEHFGKKCPACFRMQKLNESKIAADNQMSYAMRPQARVLLNALPDNDPEQRIKIVSLSDAAFGKLMSVYQDPVDGGDFMDPEDGFVMNMKRVKKGGAKSNSTFTEYEVIAGRTTAPIARDKWWEQLHDLDVEVASKELHPQKIIAIMKGEDTGND